LVGGWFKFLDNFWIFARYLFQTEISVTEPGFFNFSGRNQCSRSSIICHMIMKFLSIVYLKVVEDLFQFKNSSGGALFEKIFWTDFAHILHIFAKYLIYLLAIQREHFPPFYRDWLFSLAPL
jgi:hypothetical protein